MSSGAAFALQVVMHTVCFGLRSASLCIFIGAFWYVVAGPKSSHGVVKLYRGLPPAISEPCLFSPGGLRCVGLTGQLL